MGWFDKLFKRRPERKASDAPVAGGTATRMRTERSTVTYAHEVTAENAMIHPVIFRCVNKIASTVSTVKWYATVDEDLPKSQQGKKSEVDAINNLLKYPVDDMTPQQLLYWMAANLAVYSKFGIKVGIGVEGLPNALYPLRAAKLKAIPNGRGRTESYKYGDGEKAETLPTRKTATPERDLSKKPTRAYCVEVIIPNLMADPFNGNPNTPLAAAGLPSQVITMLMQRAHDTASGAPNSKYIVAAEKTLTPDQKNKLDEFLEESATGGEESGNVLVLTNTSVQVHPLDNNLSDIHSKVPADDMARHIAGLFGIPISLVGLGAADGAKFANNYAEGRLSFIQDTIIPCYLTPIATGLTEGICPPGVVIKFDEDTIPALEAAKAERAKKLEDVTFLTDNEKREMCGFERSSDPNADKLPPRDPVAAPNNPGNTEDE